MQINVVVVAEWLRRWTRNPLGSPRAGSNPADYGHMFVLPLFFFQDSNFLTEGFFLARRIKFDAKNFQVNLADGCFCCCCC